MSEDVLAVIDGQAINVATLQQGVSAVIERIARGDGFTFFTLNLDHVVKRRRDQRFHSAYANATFVCAGGGSIASLGRKQNERIELMKARELVLPLARQAARAGIPIGFFGATAARLDSGVRRLQGMAPGLRVAAWEAPPSGFDPTSPLAEAAIRRLVSAGTKIIFVTLGGSKPELLAHHMQSRFPDIGFVCIGASLGGLSRAADDKPRLFPKIGLARAFRVLGNPLRFGRLYTRNTLTLLSLLRNPMGKREAAKTMSLGLNS